MVDAIGAEHLFDLHIDPSVGGRRYDTGTKAGIRRWIGIANPGRFEGAKFSGKVLPGGCNSTK